MKHLNYYRNNFKEDTLNYLRFDKKILLLYEREFSENKYISHTEYYIGSLNETYRRMIQSGYLFHTSKSF